MQEKEKQEALLRDVLHVARSRFHDKPIRIWYVKLDKRAWRAIVINTVSKVKLAEGPIRATSRGSLTALKSQLAKAVAKKKSI